MRPFAARLALGAACCACALARPRRAASWHATPVAWQVLRKVQGAYAPGGTFYAAIPKDSTPKFGSRFEGIKTLILMATLNTAFQVLNPQPSTLNPQQDSLARLPHTPPVISHALPHAARPSRPRRLAHMRSQIMCSAAPACACCHMRPHHAAGHTDDCAAVRQAHYDAPKFFDLMEPRTVEQFQKLVFPAFLAAVMRIPR